MLRTSFLSEIQATDSTLIGCNAKRAATPKLCHRKPVAASRIKKSKTALSACSSRLTACGPAGPGPKSWQSRACENHVIGCQSEVSDVRNAHWMVLQVRPTQTSGFSERCG